MLTWSMGALYEALRFLLRQLSSTKKEYLVQAIRSIMISGS